MAATGIKEYKFDKVAIRLVEEPPLITDVPVTSTSVAVDLLSTAFAGLDREVLAVVTLRNDLAPINMSIVSVGTINACLAHPREIAKVPILSNAASMLLMHNHPSGNLTPSPEDIALTDHMVRVGELLEIPLMDHIILGGGDRYYSFRERGELPIHDVKYASQVSELNFAPIDSIARVGERKHEFTIGSAPEGYKVSIKAEQRPSCIETLGRMKNQTVPEKSMPRPVQKSGQELG